MLLRFLKSYEDGSVRLVRPGCRTVCFVCSSKLKIEWGQWGVPQDACRTMLHPYLYALTMDGGGKIDAYRKISEATEEGSQRRL